MSFKQEISEFEFEFSLNMHEIKWVEPVFVSILVETKKLTVVQLFCRKFPSTYVEYYDTMTEWDVNGTYMGRTEYYMKVQKIKSKITSNQ